MDLVSLAFKSSIQNEHINWSMIPKKDKDMNKPESIYNILTCKIGLYRKDDIPKLKADKFRQVLRNQLLGERMTRKNHTDSKFEYFTLMILYHQEMTTSVFFYQNIRVSSMQGMRARLKAHI
jgi:hypothetical protein